MSEAITSLPPSYAIPKPQATFLFLWHRNLCQHSLTTADGGHWQSQELQGKDKKLSYLHGTTEWEQSKAQPDCFSHPGEASNLSAVVTASAFLTGISHIRADTLPSTRRDPGADCISDNFPHVLLLFVVPHLQPGSLQPQPLTLSPPLSSSSLGGHVEPTKLGMKPVAPTHGQQKGVLPLETCRLVPGWGKTHKYVKDLQRLFLQAEAWVV